MERESRAQKGHENELLARDLPPGFFWCFLSPALKTHKPIARENDLAHSLLPIAYPLWVQATGNLERRMILLLSEGAFVGIVTSSR